MSSADAWDDPEVDVLGRPTDWGAAPFPVRGRCLSSMRPLSPREVEVAGLVAHGLANDEIARQLHLAVSTVKFHLKRVSTTIDARNRVEIAVWAWQVGLALEPSVMQRVGGAGN